MAEGRSCASAGDRVQCSRATLSHIDSGTDTYLGVQRGPHHCSPRPTGSPPFGGLGRSGDSHSNEFRRSPRRRSDKR